MNNEEIIVKITEHDGKIDRHEGRIKQLEREVSDIRDLTTSVKLLAEKQDSFAKQLSKIGNDVEEMKLKPGKKWENTVTEVIKVVVEVLLGGSLGYLLAMLFAK